MERFNVHKRATKFNKKNFDRDYADKLEKMDRSRSALRKEHEKI